MARTGYHLVDSSPWPIGVSFSALGLTSSLVGFFYEGLSSLVVLFLLSSVFLLVLCLVGWWGDVIKESTYLGCYSSLVVRNLRLAMVLFILSEVFFFVSFFWAFFYFMIGEASMYKVGHWPPSGIKPIGAFGVPLLNTAILLSSGATVTWAHKAVVYNGNVVYGPEWSGNEGLSKSLEGGAQLMTGDKDEFFWSYRMGLVGLGLTIMLGVIFTSLQGWEYYMASFTISDGVYGSTFFMMTGFHGMHVIVGTIFLTVCFFRFLYLHFSFKSFCFGLDAAVWYWHFVDVVWLFLFIFVYCWGS